MYFSPLKGSEMEKNHILLETSSFFSVYTDITCLLWRAAVATFIALKCFWFEINDECVLTSCLITRCTALMCLSADAHDLWKAESNFMACLKFPKLLPVLLSVFAVPLWPAIFPTGDFFFNFFIFYLNMLLFFWLNCRFFFFFSY